MTEAAAFVPLPLTDRQRSVVQAGAESRTLVTAGPGTGKTHTLVARLDHLVNSEGLSPGHEVLILSFTRSAVRVLRDRLRAGEGAASFSRSVTFDSFATRLLSAVDPEGEWASRSFDGRIRAATDALRSDDAAREFVSDCRHLLVDEMQDLVGDRSAFVQALLEVVPGGFTLMGDPAQGIYDYQLGASDRVKGPQALYEWVRQRFRGDLREVMLTENFRALSAEAEAALWAGDELRLADCDYLRVWRDFDDLLADLPHLGSYRDIGSLLGAAGPSTALLCRTNGEALRVSQELYRHDVPHTLQRAATDRTAVAWIGRVLSEVSGVSLSRRQFATALSAVAASAPPEAEAWSVLRRTARGGGDNVDLTALANRIRRHDLPDDALQDAPAAVVVSTVHRAKGLEFDRVVYVRCPDERRPEDAAELAAETRVRFVALTRPRRHLEIVTGPKFAGLRTSPRVPDRWTRYMNKWKITELEVRGSDVHWQHPAGAFIELEDALAIQQYIADSVHPGDAVQLRRVGAPPGEDHPVYYRVDHNEHLVGMTSEDFYYVLHRVLKLNRKWQINWPVEIEGLRVEFVDTVAGLPGVGRSAGIGAAGIYNRVRVGGLGALRFEKFDGRGGSQ